MPKIKVSEPHNKTEQELKELINGLADSLLARYGLKGSWKDNRNFQVKGTGIKGNFTANDNDVVVTLDLSLMLSPIKGKIQSKLQEKLKYYLNQDS